jgi:hypothetical protein
VSGPRISDHALVRFLDRSGGDMEGLRTRLQASLARAHAAARAMGNADYLITADSLIYVVRGDTVTTILDDDGNDGRRARAFRQPERQP